MKILSLFIGLLCFCVSLNAQDAKKLTLPEYEQQQVKALLSTDFAKSKKTLLDLFSLGHRVPENANLKESDAAVRIARAQIHKAYYLSIGDAATADKVADAIVQIQKEQ